MQARSIMSTIFATLILSASDANARIWTIRADGSGDAPTIQAGIDSSASGDSILIHAGTYLENLNTNGKALLLRGSGNPEATVLDGGLRGRVLTLDSGGQVESLTLRNGRGLLDGAGIYIVGSGPALIRNNVIENNESILPHGGGAIYCTGPLHSDVVIEFNRILGNIASGGGGLLLATSGTVRIFVRHNVIDSNVAAERGGGILANGVSITDNLIVRNVASITGGGIDLGGFGSEVSRNTVAYNQTTNTAENGAGISVDGAAISVTNNLVVGNHSIVPPFFTPRGLGITCLANMATCNLLWDNDIDLSTCTADPSNIHADPQFCAVNTTEGTNFFIQSDSPCAPSQNSCGLIGARTVGCGTTAVRQATWGRVKQRYR